MDVQMPQPEIITGTGGTITRRYANLGTTRFELVGPGTVSVISGLDVELTITGRQSDLAHVDVKTMVDTFTVTFHGGFLRHRAPEEPLRYELTSPIFAELKLSGGLAAEASNIDGSLLKVELMDGSSFTVAQLRVTEFEAKATDGSRLSVSGAVERQKVKLSGGSNYGGVALACEEADVEASGGSEATVRVGKRLKAKASNGSTVAYYGQKIDLSVETSGGSDLRHMNEGG